MKKINLFIYFSILFSLLIQAISFAQTSPDTYASFNGDLRTLITGMTKPIKNFKIKIHNESGTLIIPECYQQNRFCVTFQALHEKLDQEYIRPSLSHFQSIKEFTKRNPDGSLQNYIFFTGGDITQWKSNLMVAKQNQDGKFFALRTIDINTPRSEDPLVDESDLWHPGGIDICGNYLVIPLEPYLAQKFRPDIYRGNRLRAVFFDISNPENPQRVYSFDLKNSTGQTITCPAFALTRLRNNRYLLVCQCAYFISRGQTIDSGFDFAGNINFVNTHGIKAIDFGSSQNLSFVTVNGEIYIVGTSGTTNLSPVIVGENLANLYKVNLNINHGELFDILPGDITADLVTQISYGKECCLAPDCDFNAASNITPQCGLLSMYHWVWCGKHIPCCCFGSL